MSSEPRLHSHVERGIGTLTIDNVDKHNALSFEMWHSMPALVQALDDDPAVRVIVLRGAGAKAFAAGSDISQFGERRNTPEGVALYNTTVDRAVASVARARKPTVAWVQGYCFGGGVALALHCDLRLAAERAQFSIPAARLGVGYNHLWMQRLTWTVGPAKAKEILFTARRYDAAAALQMGLVNQVCDDAQCQALLDEMGALAPLSLMAAKAAIDAAIAAGPYDPAAAQAAIRRCFESSDYVEGRNAFGEKRPPTFSGA
jgi:enoyl-CoA hydratase/carnithine racemase